VVLLIELQKVLSKEVKWTGLPQSYRN